MKRKTRRWRVTVFLTCLSVVLQGLSVCAAEEEIPAIGPDWAMDASAAPAVFAESAILMDIDTGVTLYEKNIHAREYPASITKLLTCLVAAENSELTDIVTFSREAVFGTEKGSSNIGIDVGQQLTMEECYYAALLESANEVSSGIAEHVGGSIEGFAAMMNEKVQELGGTDSHFVNANGLHNENHYTSARDMALIGQAFFRNDTLLEISGTPFYHIDATAAQPDEIDLRHHHKMLPGCQRGTGNIYEYTIGGKNGFTTVARQTLVTCAKKDGHRLVCVVLKEEKPNHYADTKALFEYGFACFENPSVKAQIDAKAEEIEPFAEEDAAKEQTGDLAEQENGADIAENAEDAALDETMPQKEEADKPEKEASGAPSILTILVIAIVLAALVVCGLIFYRSYRLEQERKRRRAQIMARHRARRREE